MTPPTSPTSVTVRALKGHGVAVTWTASTDVVAVTEYEVFRNGDPLALVAGTALEDTHVVAAHEYCYTVRALDRSGNRSETGEPACLTMPDTTPPTVPFGLVATADDEHRATLRWRASSDDVAVVRYEVRRVWTTSAAATASGAAAQVDDLAPATHYCFVAHACDAAGNCSGDSPQACVTTPDLTPPTQPGPITVAAAGEKQVDLRWGASTDNVEVAEYQVYRGKHMVARTRSAATSVSETGLLPASEYCYEVFALDAAGNRSTPSRRACEVTPDHTPPTTPARAGALSISSSKLYLAWDPSHDEGGIAGYELLRGDAAVLTVRATHAIDSKLEPNREYCYRARAFDNAGNRSELTAQFCATTSQVSELSGPSDLRVHRLSATQMFLQWEPSDQAGVLYRVHAQANKIVGLTASNTFTPSGSMGAEPNCFRVTAVDAQGRESPQSNEVCANPLSDATGRGQATRR